MNSNVLIGIGVFLLILLLWVVGIMLGWTLLPLVAASIGVLLVWVLAMVVARVLAGQKAARLERSMREQAKAQVVRAQPERREEMEQVQRQFEAAIAALKKSKLGKGGRGDPLYALPWYLLIGPPAAGKTTAIVNSGLDFPFGTERVRGVGGTRNCDWFFSTSAIFLDTAGRYTVEEEDRDEWMGFLNLLKKHRKGTPINGVIACMDLAELADASMDEVEWHAAQLRNRIDELVSSLGVRFPVYLVFTKADLVKGFVETFGDLSRKEREQIWGTTLSPEQDDKPGVVFEAEMSGLLEVLSHVRRGQLAAPMKRDRRRSVYVFPIEMRTLAEKLTPFVDRLFQHNPYQENPVFRGFYFTSGTQEGVPIDRVIQAVARQFNLPPMQEESEKDVETKSYFIRDLFTQVIVPDQHLVARTAGAARSMTLMRVGIVAAAALVLLLLVFGTLQGFSHARGSLAGLRGTATATAGIRWDSGAAPGGNFERLDALQSGISALEKEGRWATLGMSRRGSVLGPARALYFRKASAFVDAYLYQELERRLRLAVATAGPQLNQDQVREDLRTYLLMGSEVGRLDTGERTFLQASLEVLLRNRFPFHLMRAADRETLQPLIERQVAFYAENLGQEGTQPMQNDRAVVEQVRRMLFASPSPRLVYGRIKQEAPATFAPVTVAGLVGGPNAGLFIDSTRVEGLFTRAGWEGYMQDAIAAASENPSLTDWVLGTDTLQLPPEMQDPDLLAADLENLYFTEYAEAWRAFMHSVRYRPVASLSAAADRLDRLSRPSDSPLFLLMKGITGETRFASSSALGEAAARQAGVLRDRLNRKLRLQDGTVDALAQRQEEGNPLDRQFASVHALITPDPPVAPSADLRVVLDQYAVAAAALSAVSDAGAAAPAADDAALTGALRNVQISLRDLDPFVKRALFEQPLTFATEAVVEASAGARSSKWRDQVYTSFQRDIAPYYPFNPDGQDLSLDAFTAFFHPETGVFNQFFAEEIAPVMSRRDWKPKGASFSSASIGAMRKLSAIQDAFFTPTGELSLPYRVKPELPSSPGGQVAVGQVVLTVDGQEQVFEMRSVDYSLFTWPGPGTPGASIRVQSQAGAFEPRRVEGDWAWFRLLREAQVEQKATGRYQAAWTLRRGEAEVTVRYMVWPARTPSPLVSPAEFFRVSLPASLH